MLKSSYSLVRALQWWVLAARWDGGVGPVWFTNSALSYQKVQEAEVPGDSPLWRPRNKHVRSRLISFCAVSSSLSISNSAARGLLSNAPEKVPTSTSEAVLSLAVPPESRKASHRSICKCRLLQEERAGKGRFYTFLITRPSEKRETDLWAGSRWERRSENLSLVQNSALEILEE